MLYIAISMVMIAVVLVGTAGIEQGSDEDSDTGEVILGLCFILAAHCSSIHSRRIVNEQ